MNTERVLSLDVSTKTGWSFYTLTNSDYVLEAFGQNKPISEPLGQYPENYVDWANQIFNAILTLIEKFNPDTLVIEETTSNSKSVYSQKILEFSHFLLANYIKNSKIKAVYIMTGQWKSETEARINKDETKHNKLVKEYKKKHDTSIAYNADGKRIGKITRKHVAIRRANELLVKFLKVPFKKKDEDAAESCLLGLAYCLRRIKKNKEMGIV